ncbi:MAG: hypothetical protein MK086_13965 [Flavobacteriales bacterium]|nr:hypothetical protein [Flavobacteriales bacterium]
MRDEHFQSEAKYDSLVYPRGNYASEDDTNHVFVFGKYDESAEAWKFGLINSRDKILLPVQCDQLHSFTPELNWDYHLKCFDQPFSISKKPAGEKELLNPTGLTL